jgi:hypothetical protein
MGPGRPAAGRVAPGSAQPRTPGRRPIARVGTWATRAGAFRVHDRPGYLG